MTTPLLCERVERRHPQEKCASKCVFVDLSLSLCLHLFFSTTNLILHVWLSSKKHLTVNQASLRLRRCESYHMHQMN